MKTAYLYRYQKTDTLTRGYLFIDTIWLHTLERPWQNNEINVSCIPSGEYYVDFLKKSASGKYRNVFHVINVPGRSGVLIHNGNIVDHTKGCILVGTKPGILVNQPAVLGSRSAMRQLQPFKERFKLQVI